MELKKETRVITPDGIGTVKEIEYFSRISLTRYGILHDTYPSNRPIGLYKNNILFYLSKNIKELVN